MILSKPQSFYLFDIDDNILHLPTQIVVFARGSSQTLSLSTAEFAQQYPRLSQQYRIDESSFRGFRDRPECAPEQQPMVVDVRRALDAAGGRFDWKGPSWDAFAHAVSRQRPLAFVTARGHHPETIKAAISVLVEAGWLPCEPNYLAIFPVGSDAIRRVLGDTDLTLSTPELKRRAIHEVVRLGLHAYGDDARHRFGMSDDDPDNLRLILQAMREQKARRPGCAFFVIDASRAPLRLTEIVEPHRLEPSRPVREKHR